MPLQPRTLIPGGTAAWLLAGAAQVSATAAMACRPIRWLPELLSVPFQRRRATLNATLTATTQPATPTLQSCGWSGGVWDDRDIVSWETAGGRCLTPDEAVAVLAEDKEAEEVVIQASSDGNVTGGWGGGVAWAIGSPAACCARVVRDVPQRRDTSLPPHTQPHCHPRTATDKPSAAYEGVRPESLNVRCLRKRHYLRDGVLGAAVEWFNALCVDDFDLPAFRQWQAAQADLEATGDEGAAAAGDVAARAAEAAKQQQQQQQAAGQVSSEDGEEVEDFWALQDEFYKEPAGKAAAGQQGEQGHEKPAATER